MKPKRNTFCIPALLDDTFLDNINQLTVALRFESAHLVCVAKINLFQPVHAGMHALISNFSYFLIFLFYSSLALKYSKHLEI